MANGAGRAWTPEEDDILLESRKRRESAALIARRLGRSAKAVANRQDVLRREAGYSKPINDNDIRAADDLREAILDLFARTANQRGITLLAAQVQHLGAEPKRREPGTETIQKTAGIARISPVFDSLEAA